MNRIVLLVSAVLIPPLAHASVCSDDTSIDQLASGTRLEVVGHIDTSSCAKTAGEKDMFLNFEAHEGTGLECVVDREEQDHFFRRLDLTVIRENHGKYGKEKVGTSSNFSLKPGMACTLVKVDRYPGGGRHLDFKNLAESHCPIYSLSAFRSKFDFRNFIGTPLTIGGLKDLLGSAFKLTPVCQDEAESAAEVNESRESKTLPADPVKQGSGAAEKDSPSRSKSAN